MAIYSYDTEIYTNYFLVKFQNIETKKIRFIEMFNGKVSGDLPMSLKKFLSLNTFVSFNGISFDAPILAAYLSNKNNAQIKKVCDYIIKTGSPQWITYREFKLREPKFDHIDLKEVAPGVAVSLKGYMGRMASKKMQDLPIEPDATLTREQANEISTYCDNDLDGTTSLYFDVERDIKLRETLTEKYGVDLRSKSGAQMAESLFKSDLEPLGIKCIKRADKPQPFKYKMPEWVKFSSPEFQVIQTLCENETFTISKAGKPELPKAISKVIKYKDLKLKFGIGGIHSQEKKQSVIAQDGYLFSEKDVNSLYPSIIIEQKAYPKHLGPKFLDVYKKMYNERFASKAMLKTAKGAELDYHNLIVATNKLALNSSYGKFGSVYSYLYSPELVIQTTITGQLAMLMLIERLSEAGATITSANTDSVDVLRPAVIDSKLDEICFQWELETGYELDDTPYKSKHSESVNSYVAVTPYGVKGKGTFASESLMKSPNRVVCAEAVKEYCKTGASIVDHINNETNPHKFCTVKRVTGGAIYDGEEVGKMVRFYHSTVEGCITYKKNGNKVPTSDGCKPLMDLPDTLPDDLDRQWYIDEANKLIGLIGL